MNSTRINPNPRPVTIADLCEAIYSGRLNVTATDEYYMVKMRDLVQLARMATPQRIPARREQTQPLALAS